MNVLFHLFTSKCSVYIAYLPPMLALFLMHCWEHAATGQWLGKVWRKQGDNGTPVYMYTYHPCNRNSLFIYIMKQRMFRMQLFKRSVHSAFFVIAAMQRARNYPHISRENEKHTTQCRTKQKPGFMPRTPSMIFWHARKYCTVYETCTALQSSGNKISSSTWRDC